MAVHGSILNVSIRGRKFAVASDGDSNRRLGGTANEIETNGDGTSRIIKSIQTPAFSNLTLALNHSRDDQEFLQETADNFDFVPVSVTYADGTTYTGRGQLIGAIEFSSQKGTCDINIEGEGRYTKI